MPNKLRDLLLLPQLRLLLLLQRPLGLLLLPSKHHGLLLQLHKHLARPQLLQVPPPLNKRFDLLLQPLLPLQRHLVLLVLLLLLSKQPAQTQLLRPKQHLVLPPGKQLFHLCRLSAQPQPLKHPKTRLSSLPVPVPVAANPDPLLALPRPSLVNAAAANPTQKNTSLFQFRRTKPPHRPPLAKHAIKG